ncbi:protein kinase family protein [Oceanobacillus halotolerans]|uniref:hypothetical protein n=1 Tax=Oceanobacillus halotolerans TaxID=2663380 RepID=UPI0013DD19BC|nr:hypothetical protein [Oceanobacillus halotolerans]
MEQLLHTYYGIQNGEELLVNQRKGIIADNSIYFIMDANNNEIIHMEQAVLSSYLAKHHYPYVAEPIQNIHGDWFTTYQGKKYMVLQVNHMKETSHLPHGEELANFHNIGATYQYQPQTISSYGQWEQLWINKLTIFENQIEQYTTERSTYYARLLMDSLPYLIGISENAIQYLHESEQEQRFHEVDQGTITFHRYQSNVLQQIIWPDDLIYDHPTRDLAEFIRVKWLEGTENPNQEVIQFLNDYQTVRPLSIFSWRLIYARLLFPIHLFDVIAKSFLAQSTEDHYAKLDYMLKQQTVYESRLRDFFHVVGLDTESLSIPVLNWL